MERALTRTATVTTEELADSLASIARGRGTAGPYAGGFASALIDELFEGTVAQRTHAAARIEAILGLEAVAPLCEALHAETEPEVLSAICASLGRLGEEEAIDHLRPHLSSEEPTVRAAALEACLRLVRSEAERTSLVELGLADASASVRRRAYLAAAALPGVELLPWAMRCRADGDPHLRRLAYVTLASEPDPAVSSMALDALLDPDEGVRSAVASLLERRLGKEVEALASLSPIERRREIRALEARMAAREETKAAPKEGIAFEEIEAVLMTALRGTMLADLAAELGRDEPEVARAVQRYLSEGRIVLRGTKLYLP